MAFFGKKSLTTKQKRGQTTNLKQYTEQTLGGNLALAVQLPEGEDVNEWLAVNTVDFYNQINLLYGTLTEYCTKGNNPPNELCATTKQEACHNPQKKCNQALKTPFLKKKKQRAAQL